MKNERPGESEADRIQRKRISENQKQLTAKQKEEIKKAFDFFDITGSGTIEAKNLKVVLRALGFDPSNEEIVKLIKDLGRSDGKIDTQKIDFQEFLEIMIVKMSQKDTGSDIDKAFTLFEDKEKRDKFTKEGKPEVITKNSLMKVVHDLEEDMTEEEIEELILGAIDKKYLLTMGEIKSEDKDDKKNNFDDHRFMVSKSEFMKILSADLHLENNTSKAK